jgi:hypothetical protein
MTKQQAISQMILNRASDLAAARCVTLHEVISEAIDFVLGGGTYGRLVSDLYDDLRAKAA